MPTLEPMIAVFCRKYMEMKMYERNSMEWLRVGEEIRNLMFKYRYELAAAVYRLLAEEKPNANT